MTRSIRRNRHSRHRLLFVVDMALFLAFVLVIDVPLTGLAVHEWLGILISGLTVVHLVQHGNWVASARKRMFGSASLTTRLDFLLMSMLFIAYGTIVFSGLVISEVALPYLGIVPSAGSFWLWLHLASVVLTVWLTALHVALNWAWTRNALSRYVAAPLRRLRWSRS